MNQSMVSEDELLEWLNSQLREDEDSRDCSFLSILRLAEEDKGGCNWSTANLRCSGVPVRGCETTAASVVAMAKEKFNVR